MDFMIYNLIGYFKFHGLFGTLDCVIRNLVWYFRQSPISRPWFAIKTWIHLHWHARAMAIVLENHCRASGQMDHVKGDPGHMQMSTAVRSNLTVQRTTVLPKWKWR